MEHSFSGRDVGKRVTTACGQKVGTVTRVERGYPYVEPVEPLDEELRERLGWLGRAEEYRLEPVAVADVESDRVELRAGFSTQ